MKWFKSFAIAFSLYSKIPMPHFEWEEDDMKYVVCFFPWVGAIIGCCFWGWAYVCNRFQVDKTAYLLFGTAIPILLTGGFHIDGYMDTMDAVHSYQSRERKLEILKDSHIGAFSVIMLLLYYLIYVAALAEIKDEKAVAIVGIGFIVSRCLSGIGVVIFQPAKKDGILRTLSDRAGKKVVLLLLLIQLVLSVVGMLALSLKTGILAFSFALASFVYYRYFSYREFGGVTGDTAGYFLQICEAAIVVGVALGGGF